MKKIFAIAMAVVAILVLSGCGDNDDNVTIRNNSDFMLSNVRALGANLGTINSGSSASASTSNIFRRSLEFNLVTANGTIGANVNLRDNSFTVTNDTWVYVDDWVHFWLPSSGGLKAIFDELNDRVAFTIRNESSRAIHNVVWNNVNFTREGHVFVLQPGSNVSITIDSGTGHIFLTVDGRNARTSSVVVTEKGTPFEFVFNNNTLVVNLATNELTTLGNF